MAEKIEKSIPWMVIIAIFTMVIFGVGIVLDETLADTVIPSVTVGSAAPQLGTIILNGGNAISLTEGTSVYIYGTTTVTDSNGYTDITSVTSSLQINNTTTGCTDDPNWCYNMPNGVASGTCATTSCSDSSCTIFCGVYMWFIAEATDASGTYPSNAWEMNITVTDAASNVVRGSTTEELSILPATEITGTIGYSCGGNCSPLATSSETATRATNTGNIQIDMTLLGESMASDTTEIDTGRQKYSTASDMLDWTIGTALTSSTADLWNFDLPKSVSTNTFTNAYDDIYWQIKIPDAQPAGTYTGTTTITPVWTVTSTAVPG